MRIQPPLTRSNNETCTKAPRLFNPPFHGRRKLLSCSANREKPGPGPCSRVFHVHLLLPSRRI